MAPFHCVAADLSTAEGSSMDRRLARRRNYLQKEHTRATKEKQKEEST
jgi:hypothetical protein